MNNGDGEDTPTETPAALLDIHRPYVLVLGAAIPPLNSVVNTLGEILHEIRIARDPIGITTRRSISECGAQIEAVGRSIKDGFAAQEKS